MKYLFLLGFLTFTSCTELFHYPSQQIHMARADCIKNTTIESHCVDLCSLENSAMLTSSGDAPNPKEFGPFYMQYVEKCWTYKTKPTCGEAHDFMACYYEKSANSTQDAMTACLSKYPVKDLKHQEVSPESLAKDQNLACLVTCFGERSFAFNDDDTINMNSINPHIPFEFDAKEAVKTCEEGNKQDNKCQKRAMRHICVVRAFEVALQEDFLKKQAEFTKG